jgi:peptide/nickel transport system substrate-binding protein
MDDSGLTLVRHQAFHGRRPLLDQIGLRFYPDAASATLALAAGEVDGFAGLTHAEVNRPADGEPLTVRESPLQAHQTLLSINHRDPVLSDPTLRRAIALTVNREALVQGPLAGQAVPAYGPVPAYSWAYERAVEAPADPARAQRLLDEAGWVGAPVRARNGRSLRLRLLVPAEDRLIAVATALAGQLQPLGIETDVQPTETLSLYREHLMARNYALALYGVWLGTIDPDPWALWHSSQRQDGFNFASYSNPRADEALARARATADPSQRFAALSAFQQLWLEDVPSLSLYSPLMFVATPADLLGVRLGITPEPSARFQHLDEWHLHTQRVPLFAR